MYHICTYVCCVLQAIQAIADQWKELYLEVLPHKDRGHYKLKLVKAYTTLVLLSHTNTHTNTHIHTHTRRASEEVFQMLEDNQVTLSTMKASRYVKAFEKEVDYWERTLSHILEVIEMTLQVQRQWMYLEVYTILKCTYLVKGCGPR